MSQQLVAFFCGCVQGDRVVHLVLNAEGYFFVTAVHGTGRSVHQVFYSGAVPVVAVAAGFQNIVKTDDVAFNVSIRVVDGVPYPCLGRQVYNDGRLVFGKNFIDERLIRRLIRIQVQKTQPSVLYDLDYDLQLNAAIKAVQNSDFAGMLKNTKTLRQLQEEAELEAASEDKGLEDSLK